MNNPSPLVPQGSLLEQKNKNRARAKVTIFFVLAVHGIGLMALLVQGCHDEGKSAAKAEETNNVAAMPFEQPNPVLTDTGTANSMATNPVPLVPDQPGATPFVPGNTTEYSVVKGDSFSTIAKKFHVTSKAISEANPTVEATKLQIGQKLHIPAPAPVAQNTGSSAPVEAPSGEQTWTVKSGDTLIKIASKFGTSAKAIRGANGLKTDSIKVGQKLRIPVKTPPAIEAASATTTVPAVAR